MLLPPRKNGLDSLFKEVRVFKEIDNVRPLGCLKLIHDSHVIDLENMVKKA